jgi:hypothetical protein
MNHHVTRRINNNTTNSTTNTINEGHSNDRRLSSALASMEVVENRRLHHRIDETANGSRSGTRRRRRKATTVSIADWNDLKGFSIASIQLLRQIGRYFRRRPEEVYALAILVLGATLLLCLMFLAIIEKQQHSNTSVHTVRNTLLHNDVPALHHGSNSKTNHRDRKKGPYHKRGKDGIRILHQPRGTDRAANVLRGSPRSDLPLSKQTASFDIVFASIMKTAGDLTDNHWGVPLMSSDVFRDGEKMDYGGLHIEILKEGEGVSYRRKIYHDSWSMKNEIPSPPPDVNSDFYYAFDDDRLRNEPIEGQTKEETRHCRRISEHRINFPICNMFHETQQIQNHIKYLRYVCTFREYSGRYSWIQVF